jgi:glucose/arabinose dehydrogenase
MGAPMRRPLLLLAAALIAAPAANAAPQLQKLGDFDQPLYVASAPGDSSRLYVVEKAGTIRVLRNGVKLAAPFADLSADVSDVNEQGLLSIAFTPDFPASRLLYAYFTDNEGDIRVDQLRAPSADLADPAYRRTTVEIPHPGAANHNGGTARFGPDGYLWLATGDGGGSNDQFGNAQDTSSLLGKVLRIAPRPGLNGYDVPAGNPFGNAVWSYGLRNPFRFSFDRATGDLFLGDVGQGTTEEIDRAPAASSRGLGWNYGWPDCEGSFMRGSTTAACPADKGVKPIIDQFQPQWRTINGGVVVRDPGLPSLYGSYLYGDTYNGYLHSALPDGSADHSFGLTLPGVAGITEDGAGHVYLASLSGGVYRLVDPSAPATGSTADRTPPSLRTRVKRRQRVLRNRGVIAYARSSENGSVALASTLRVGARSYRLRYVRRPAEAGQRVRLKGRLTARARRALRRALNRGRRARVRVALRARDAAGNRSPLARARVRVRR